MPLLQLIILALIQGITEFIPVSSSAHLIIVPELVDGWADQGPLIDVAVHVGSLGAVMIYFRTEVARIILGIFDTVRMQKTKNRELFWFIAIATVPIIIIAPLIYMTGLVDALRSLTVIGCASIGFGLILWWADKQPINHDNWTWKRVLIVGCAQALAIIPGTSRSGITITAARFLGISRPEAARFSMLLSIPTISAFGLFAALELLQEGTAVAMSDALIGALLSFMAAYAAIHLFMKMTSKMSFTPFVVYRCGLGLILLGFALL